MHSGSYIPPQSQASTTSATGRALLALALLMVALLMLGTPALPQAADDATDVMEIEEIVVTATKRSGRSLIETPAGVSTFQGTRLEDQGAQSLKDFLQLSPATSIATSAQGAGSINIQIRGVNSSFGSATVGYYLDESPLTYLNVNILPDIVPFDLESVEVLRGPQGTLYGAGSAGGVIVINTADPRTDRIEAKSDAAISFTKSGGTNYRTAGMVNVPLIKDKLAIRGVVSYEDLSGFIDSIPPNGENYNTGDKGTYRIKLRATPTDRLTVDLKAEFIHLDFDGQFNAGDDLRLPSFDPQESLADIDQYVATVRYDFDSITVQNTVAYVETQLRRDSGIPLAVETVGDLETITNELRVNSTHDGPFTWVAGFYYRDLEQFIFQDLVEFGFPVNLEDNADSQQFSIYGDASLALFDRRVELSVGLSYFDDDTEQVSDLRPFLPQPLAPEVKTDRFTPRASITFRPNDMTTLFAGYSQGFRPATVNLGLATAAQLQVDPTADGTVGTEKIDSFEVGVKAELWDSRIYAELIGFYIETRNTQQDIQVPVPNAPTFTAVVSGPRNVSQGLESLLRITPIDTVSVTLNASYTDAEVDQDFFLPGLPGLPPIQVFAEGDPVVSVPKWIVGAQVNQRFDLGNGFLADVLLNGQYNSRRFNRLVTGRIAAADRIFRLDSRIEVSRDFWSAYVFADNLTDEGGATDVIDEAAQFAEIGQSIEGEFGPRLRPRTFGFGLRLRY